MIHKAKKTLHHLRKQPHETKRHIIHVIMFVFGFILFSLWSYSLGQDLGNTNTQLKFKQDLVPFSTLKDSMVGNAGNYINLKNETIEE